MTLQSTMPSSRPLKGSGLPPMATCGQTRFTPSAQASSSGKELVRERQPSCGFGARLQTLRSIPLLSWHQGCSRMFRHWGSS